MKLCQVPTRRQSLWKMYDWSQRAGSWEVRIVLGFPTEDQRSHIIHKCKNMIRINKIIIEIEVSSIPQYTIT